MIRLTPDITACSARIFLNIFGFTLEDKTDLIETDRVKIFDKDNNEVGEYYLEGDKANISLRYKGNYLSAEYEIPKTTGMIDFDDAFLPRFAVWVSGIRFNYSLNDGATLKGCFNLRSWVDEKNGIRTTGHTEMKYITPDKNETFFKVFNNLTLFYVSEEVNNTEETIDILTSNNEWLGYAMLHKKKDGLDDNWTHSYISEVTEFSNEPGYKRVVAGDLYKKDGKLERENYINTPYIKKRDINDYKIELMENIGLIKEVDPTMFEKIKEICESFKVGDTLVLKNLVCASLDSFSDEQFEEIFGFERDRSFYQDGANSLTDSYFKTKSKKINDNIKKLVVDSTREWF